MRRSGLASASASIAPALALTIASASMLACASCSAPATCDAQANSYEAQLVESEEQSGSLLLSEASVSQTLRFRATLRDLPELWSSFDTVQNSALPLDLSVLYESEPFGGDGHTEMPRLSVTLSEPAFGNSTASTTSNYPGPTPVRFTPGLFGDCAFGSRTCQTTISVHINRLDGAPFPPVRVNFRATVSAHINVCSVLSTNTRATLEVEAP